MTPAEREALVLEHLPLARHVARSFASCRAVPFDDLESYAKLGLIRAAERWDETRGLKFGTFAGAVIRFAVIDGIRSETRGPEFWTARGRETDDSDGPENNCPDPRFSADISDASIDLRALHARLTARLTLREKRIVGMYYGDETSMARIARAEGVCESYVWKLIHNALAVMRKKTAPDREKAARKQARYEARQKDKKAA